MNKPPSNFKISAILGLLSIPCWFLLRRFPHELDTKKAHHPTIVNPGSLEALRDALGLAVLSFLLIWLISSCQSRKR